jgi:predicted unusual protein kinase regulating ubiquinone biosynthesis (AarF/ABC1/UbiB family)
MFKDDENVYVPKIYHNLTRERVLVMSFEEGIPITHVKDIYN